MNEFENDQPASEADAPEAEAQRASDALKEQIAAVRKRIREAKDTLRAQAGREPKSFKR